MPTKDHLEISSGQPMIALESDFIDFQQTQELCPTRDVSGGAVGPSIEESLRQVAAALSLLNVCGGDANKAQSAIELAIRVHEGSVTDPAAIFDAKQGEKHAPAPTSADVD